MFAAGETTPEEVKAAKTKAKDAQTRIAEIKQLASERPPIDVDSLQRDFELRKFSNELMDEELRAAQKELKALPKTYVPPVEAAAEETAEQIASRTKQGASGASNWVRAMAEDIPEVLAAQAENMRKDNPKGGQAIIDAYAAAKEKLQRMGLGDFKLTEAGPGQLALPPQEAARLEQELSARRAQEAAEQSARAQQVEAQRLAAEADLQRQRQVAEQRVEQARKSKISAGERASEAKKTANTAKQQAEARARSDAAKLETATINARTAQQTAREAAEAQPSALKVATREAGRRFAEKAPIIGNVLGAAGATLSADEAIERYKKGDYS
jgi:type I site-specific restriction-modification system R (restriction) subunit